MTPRVSSTAKRWRLGLCLAHEFSARLGVCPAADAARVAAHLTAAGLPTRISQIPGARLDADTLMRFIAQDKKVERGALTFILTKGVGQAYIARDVPRPAVLEFLGDFAAR